MPRHQARTLALAKAGPVAARPVATPTAQVSQDSLLPGLSELHNGQTAQAQAAAMQQASGGQLVRAGAALLHMQSQYGNRYVQQVISHAREARAPVVQAKLALGPASDRYEQEADRVAARLAGHAPSHAPAANSRAAEDGRPGAMEAPTAQALQRARGGGQPLPATLRRSMEQALGADLGGVRLHTGGQSDRLARSVQAAALTSGQDIFFRRGAYAPANPRGTALLAHEVTHVVQQRNEPCSTVQRFFDPPANPLGKVLKPANPLALKIQGSHLTKGPGWAISKEVEPAQELRMTQGTRAGHKVKRFTALLTPGHAKLGLGVDTQQGIDPLGWDWVLKNELRTSKGKLRYWVRFHLLNARLGGKGTKERHLVPTTKAANAQWLVRIERAMKAALAVDRVPVYYDVQLTYWDLGDAPTTYNVGSGDYRPNIELFPKSTEGNWKRYEKKRWVDQPSVRVTVDKPRGIKGEHVELTTNGNLKLVASQFNIDEKILRALKARWRTAQLTSYRDVRQLLEDWAMGEPKEKKIFACLQAIYASDGYLREALDGKKSFRLTINGQSIPDDDTPEAKLFGPVVKPADYLHNAVYLDAEGPISIAYQQAQRAQNGTSFPTFEEFLWQLTTEGHLYPVKLTAVQQRWNQFKAANKLLPPLRDTHLVPKHDEIFFMLLHRTQQPVVDWLRHTYTERLRQLPRGTADAADELAQTVGTKYRELLELCFKDLTVEHAGTLERRDGTPKLVTAVLGLKPVSPLVTELDDRLAVVPEMQRLDITGSLGSNPFTTSLAVPLAERMRQLVAAEQQRIADEKQRVAALPQPAPPRHARTSPVRRHTVAGYLHSPQPGSGIQKQPKTDPYRQTFLRTLRTAVLNHPRYRGASPADQAMFRQRTEEVEALWSRHINYVGNIDDDRTIAFKRIFH